MSLGDRLEIKQMKHCFRGFLPVVVDIETSGMNPQSHALLEMCIVMIGMNEKGDLIPREHYFEHILPFEGAQLDAECLAFNHIDPFQPLRFALEEKQALARLFSPIHQSIQKECCSRAVLVGHNAWFDLLFIKEAAKRTQLNLPFHAFTCFDTATLSGMAYGQTVLSKAAQKAGIEFDEKEAHSAIYDALKTAELFCRIANSWQPEI